jgi:hypothetical protein
MLVGLCGVFRRLTQSSLELQVLDPKPLFKEQNVLRESRAFFERSPVLFDFEGPRLEGRLSFIFWRFLLLLLHPQQAIPRSLALLARS